MEVDRSLVNGAVGAFPLGETEHRTGCGVDDREGIAVARAEREPRRGCVAPLPDEPGRRTLELGQQRRPLERLGPERFGIAIRERPFVGRRIDVRVEDARVCVIEACRLDPATEQRLRLAHEELVERVLARDEHREPVSAPTRASPLLAQRRNRAGEADRDRAVQLADVDPELEGVGGANAEQLSLDEPPLDLAPLCRRIAGAVRRQARRRRGIDAIGGEAVDQLGGLAALCEADRAQTARDEPGHQERCLRERARTDAELRVEERRIPEHDLALCVSRCVRLDDRRCLAGQCERELTWIRDRGGGQQELGLGAVDAGEPPQPPQHVADVGAEDAAVDVCLVDDDVAQVVQHVAPPIVVGEDADVQHVRVRQDHVRAAPDLPPPLGLRVAVVDRGTKSRQAEPREAARLILGQRLRRVEVQGACGRLARDRVEHREVESERLPGRRTGRDDDVLAACGRLPRLGLMGVEAADPCSGRARLRPGRRAPPGAVRPAPRERARLRGTQAPRRRGGHPRAGSPADVGGERPLRSGPCRAPRRLSRALRRPQTGSPSGSRGRRNATACRGWRRCRGSRGEPGRPPRQRSRREPVRSPCRAGTRALRTRRSPGSRSRAPRRRTSNP